jgi:hypothetical protein
MGQASGEQQTIGMVAQTFLSVGPPDTDKSVRATVPYWVGMVAQTFLSVGPPEHRQECLCHRSLGGNGGTDIPVCGPAENRDKKFGATIPNWLHGSPQRHKDHKGMSPKPRQVFVFFVSLW